MEAAEYETPADQINQGGLGRAHAFCELVRGLYPRLFWTALRIVKDRADAEDVVQDAL